MSGGEGNPNHDEHGRFASGEGGGQHGDNHGQPVQHPDAAANAHDVHNDIRDYTKLDPNISASDYTSRMTELRGSKPSPIEKLWNNPSSAPADRVAAQKDKIKAWNREYNKVSKNQKQALERDNTNFRARQG
jgi:hypothetical protein